MIYRLTLAAIAAVFFGIAAQSANAAISLPDRPMAQEMDHGLQQNYGGGSSSTSTPPASDSTEATATESIPSPSEQGISTSPGVAPATEPITEPVAPGQETQQAEQEDDRSEADCAALNDHINAALAMAEMFGALAGAFEGAEGGPLTDKAKSWAEEAEISTDMEYEDGCNSAGGETAE
jgi:hypothetical protein